MQDIFENLSIAPLEGQADDVYQQTVRALNATQRSKLIFSISRLLATFIFKMVANGKFRSPKIVVSLTQDTSCYLHEGATAERCVRK